MVCGDHSVWEMDCLQTRWTCSRWCDTFFLGPKRTSEFTILHVNGNNIGTHSTHHEMEKIEIYKTEPASNEVQFTTLITSKNIRKSISVLIDWDSPM